MDCGIPFCHKGCPLGNIIPDFNDYVYKGQWERALATLQSTNNFPEFTGRICPAPCEAACTLSINTDPVTIEYIEKAIADRGWEEGWIKPQPPKTRTGKRVAVIGSGPSGLAAAQQLNRAGHTVTVFERENYLGGLLRLGIPDFKLEKMLVERRVQQMRDEGIEFRTGVYVGRNYSVEDLKNDHDAVLLCIGSTVPRDLAVSGRELKGVHFAMDFLTQQNKLLSGETFSDEERISAEGKRVIILGGGDTGADCLATSHRQGAEIVRQFDIIPEPPEARRDNNPWPQWPIILRRSYALEEGGSLDYSIGTKGFSGSNGQRGEASRREPGVEAGRDGTHADGRSARYASSTWTPTSYCWPLVSCTRSATACSRASASSWTRGATSRRTPTRCRALRACSRPAMRRAANRWSCGRSRRAARLPAASTFTSWGRRSSRARCRTCKRVRLSLPLPPLLRWKSYIRACSQMDRRRATCYSRYGHPSCSLRIWALWLPLA